ncbi:hypothetical protein ISF_06825 [Cordyceps fumosorosea ARSEF 2679]|uniref:Uncharacterized protein n=1 Tax=Cordyceps fumosorosea (strain ARSEF 2679) TaxID=1081104 RepID=A0A167R5C3_CORFA|nr:hypothetical protein ISF_06825 [Cordyceps fumosorosea ARSEF 2679]OAA58286.1 hypothetical protein ISF_06825 [Cordyceps fumosorosea ARSEF 2679]
MAVDSELRPTSAPVAHKLQQLNGGIKVDPVQNGAHKPDVVSSAVSGGYADIDGIADKFRQHLTIPIIDKSTGDSSWTVLIPGSFITEKGTSVDSINDCVSAKPDWRAGDVVVDGITVRAVVGSRGLLLSAQQSEKSHQSTSVHLDESGSSANVSLKVQPDGTLEVHKTCSHDGIDENGRPWLERQNRFLETSVAVRETDIFVRPLRFTASDETFSIDFPYLPSQTLAQLAMAGMGGDLLLDTTSALLGEMAQKVWPKTATEAPADFIEKAHFDRIDRRVAIARAAVPELGAIVDSSEVILNGRTLLGFHAVTEQLRQHPALRRIAPTLIGEIHGDLNLHNILCCVGPAARRPVALIDPRGVHLLSDFAHTRDFEPGDYAYELSKLKFSLSAFSEIRHGYLTLEGAGTEFWIRFRHHAGSETMRQADAGFFDALAANAAFMSWVKEVEPAGFDALRMRVLLGEAANFVADAACALGRDTVHEVVPLFLIGLDKLNSVLATLNDNIPEHKLDDWFARSGEQDTTAGIQAVQQSLLKSRTAAPLWDVLEISVPAGLVLTAKCLLENLRGRCFPRSTVIYRSSTPGSEIAFPCVLLHDLEENQSATCALLSKVKQSNTFFEASGVSNSTRDALRIISVQATSDVSSSFGRQGNKLLAPGPWGASPLELILLTAQQLRFAKGGRWVLDDSSFSVFSRGLKAPSGDVCVLIRSIATDQILSPLDRVFQDVVYKSRPDEPRAVLSGPVFLSTEVAIALASAVAKVVQARGSLLSDILLAPKMDKSTWMKLYRATSRADAEEAWDAAQKLSAAVPAGVEPEFLSSGDDESSVYKFGSLEEYRSLVERAKSDPDMNSLAFLAATLAWREQWTIGE